MTLKDYESGDRTNNDGDATEMGDVYTFTFDTENVEPAKNFHIPSILTERKLQRIAVKVARVHPNIVTVGDYRDIPKERLRTILRELNLPPRDVQVFTDAVQGYISAVG